MSRHMAFWKYNDNTYLDNQKVYEESCCSENFVDGLAMLPISDILLRVDEVFDSYDKLDDSTYESAKGAFSISATKQSVLFDCGWSMDEAELNKIIDTMLEFDCPLYDPQIETRFDKEDKMDELNKRWQEAYQANPRVYENENGDLLVGFALTEDTDSLFPLYPEQQWAIEGKVIGSWIITMVSLTNPQGGIIGQMEYHEAMKRLQPYIIASAENWALIRGMTHNELDSLFEGLPRKLI